MYSSIWQRHQVVKDHSKITKVHFWMIQRAKNEVFDHFLEFGHLDRLDIAYFDCSKCFLTFGKWYQFVKDYSKVTKMHFWLIQGAKNEVFGHFLDFGPSNGLDIANFDRTKCSSMFGKVARSWRIIQKPQKLVFEWSKMQKSRFLAVFWT